MKSKNPFVVYGYEGPDTFCDRKAETEKLKSALENGRNVNFGEKADGRPCTLTSLQQPA